MIDKNIFVYKLFCHQIFQIWFYFFVKIATPHWKKLSPSFPATPLSKLRSCQAPLFENLVGGSTLLPSRKDGGCTLCYTVSIVNFKHVIVGQDVKYSLRFNFLTLIKAHSNRCHTLAIKQEARPLLEEIQ